jgi:hypothetical protein
MKTSFAPQTISENCPPCSWPTREGREPLAAAVWRTHGVAPSRWLISKVA